MARGVRYRPSRRAAKKIMNAPIVQEALWIEGGAVKSAADGIGEAKYGLKVERGSGRAHAFVYTPSKHAINSNAKYNSLLKALKSRR